MTKSGQKKKSATSLGSTRSHSARAVVTAHAEVEVKTTIRTRPTEPGTGTQQSLTLLRDLKKIQSSLRKDDLSWDS